MVNELSYLRTGVTLADGSAVWVVHPAVAGKQHTATLPGMNIKMPGGVGVERQHRKLPEMSCRRSIGSKRLELSKS